MADPRTMVVPRESVNDDVVVLVRWHVRPGEAVRAGAPLFDIETTKAAIQVDADHDGYLEPLVAEGDEVAVGGEVCRIHAAPFAAAAPRAAAAVAAGGDGPAISKKARALMDERGLDPSLFSHLPHVREADVIRHLEEAERVRTAGGAAVAASAAAAGPGPAAGASGTSSGASAGAGAPAPSGNWLKDASVASRERGHGIVWLAFNYLFRNYLLGNLVAIAPRGVILPLHRLRGVKIGKGCYIDPTAIVETAYPENVTIGNDVRITARAVIMTHIKAPHYLRETGIVPNVLKPVVLEDHCFIGVNSVIMPGVTVGKASVVASGAVVLADVPPYTMVAGNPAKVIRRFPRPNDGGNAGGER